jgi:SH3 domain protein
MRHLLPGLLLAIAGSAAAETVYVHDYLRLSVRASPTSSSASIQVVATGDVLAVLERAGDYIRVRTEEGTEGWVSNSYVSSERPARLQLEELRQDLSRIEAETERLRSELRSSNERGEAVTKQLNEVAAENSSLQQQLSRYTGSSARLAREYAWLIQGAFIVGLFLLGFSLGVRWYKRRLAARLGGLEI